MENKKQKMKKEEVDKKIKVVRQAIIELRSDSKLMKKVEKVLAC